MPASIHAPGPANPLLRAMDADRERQRVVSGHLRQPHHQLMPDTGASGVGGAERGGGGG